MTELTGVVARGSGLGAKLGFPTANIRFDGRPPERGVWTVVVSGAGLKDRKAVCNVGVRPTVSQRQEVIVEVHIPGFSGDLYEQKLTIKFISKLRDEKKFGTLDELKAQIARDIAQISK
jgi:riboflavin kinase / FMN adenylyltransferase